VRYLRVKNWEKFQHYDGDGRPVWIKLYTALLDPLADLAYTTLADASKILLHHIWLMAAVFKNRIPMDFVTKDRLNIQSRPNLVPLVASGFIEILESNLDPSNARFESLTGLTLSQENHGGESEGDQFPAERFFEEIWPEYPNRIGRKAALKHFTASVTSPEDYAAIRTALRNYAAHLTANPWKHPQHGSTWFNNWREWVDDPTAKAPDPLAEEMRLLDEIREAAGRIKLDVRCGTASPEQVEYLDWLAPDGGRMRDDAVSFDEWMERVKGVTR
jgi:hypothetical protein